MGGYARCLEGIGGKVGSKLENCHFPGKSGQLFQFCPGRLEAKPLFYPPMCILSKQDCATFGVSNLCLSKVIKEKPWSFQGFCTRSLYQKY